jgi:cytochrome c oxidase subunit 1
MITTILTLRAPGMTMFRMPIFTWNILITSLLVLMVFRSRGHARGADGR